MPFDILISLTGPQRQPPTRPADFWTVDDRRLARLLVAGLTTAAMARECNVSERTVYRQLDRLYGRMGVHGRTEAVVAAILTGLYQHPKDVTAVQSERACIVKVNR